MQRNQLQLRLRPDFPAFSEPVLKRTLPSSMISMAETEDEKRAIKEALMNELADWMDRNNLKQVEAAHILGVAPPRVSDAINKKTLKFTVDALIDLLAKTGKHVHLSIL
ncbi:MAG: XRE family transcriptional regulator [Comamonadaceae bacterium PBBC2]|nr:MAG: XRE family transcriptional regulator [Comamonadaceae bacterium PBBC2]